MKKMALTFFTIGIIAVLTGCGSPVLRQGYSPTAVPQGTPLGAYLEEKVINLKPEVNNNGVFYIWIRMSNGIPSLANEVEPVTGKILAAVQDYSKHNGLTMEQVSYKDFPWKVKLSVSHRDMDPSSKTYYLLKNGSDVLGTIQIFRERFSFRSPNFMNATVNHSFISLLYCEADSSKENRGNALLLENKHYIDMQNFYLTQISGHAVPIVQPRITPKGADPNPGAPVWLQQMYNVKRYQQGLD